MHDVTTLLQAGNLCKRSTVACASHPCLLAVIPPARQPSTVWLMVQWEHQCWFVTTCAVAAAAWACTPTPTGGPNVDHGCPTGDCNARQANLGGDLLVLNLINIYPLQKYDQRQGDTVGKVICVACGL